MSVASSTIFIRLAGVVDAEAMAAIHRACFAKNLERERDRTILARARLSFAPRLAVTGTNGARVSYR